MEIRYTGYHGTSSEHADSIEQDGLTISGQEHWLGQGYYFYDNIDSALNWGGSNPAVFKADLISDEERILDCFSPSGQTILGKVAKWLEQTKQWPTDEEQDYYARALFEILHNEELELMNDFDIIRAPYHKPFPIPLKPTVFVIKGIELHICVKQAVCITNFERVKLK